MYKVINYNTKEEYQGFRGATYTDIDIARHQAKHKSANDLIALYDYDKMINLYYKGLPVKLSDFPQGEKL
jgi:hypothetical protein